MAEIMETWTYNVTAKRPDPMGGPDLHIGDYLVTVEAPTRREADDLLRDELPDNYVSWARV